MFFVVDTLRADRLGAYGHALDTTPNIDRLAAESVVFEQAFVTAPRTWQSFSSILTGLNPPGHQVRFIFDRPLEERVPTLGALLQAEGYATVAFDSFSPSWR